MLNDSFRPAPRLISIPTQTAQFHHRLNTELSIRSSWACRRIPTRAACPPEL